MSIDTPDYQRGVVNAQKLVGEFPGTQKFATVDIPPNAETLVVTFQPGGVGENVTCQGVTTSIDYVGIVALPGSSTVSTASWFFDVSNAVDRQVSITLANAPGVFWYVYADAAPHLIADVSKRTNAQGVQYVSPVAPSTAAGDHPPVELQTVTVTLTGNSVVIPAPPAGQRLRLFHVAAGIFGGSGFCTVSPNEAGENLVTVGSGAPVSMSYAPSGVVLAAATALQSAQAQGGTSWYVSVAYTVETV